MAYIKQIHNEGLVSLSTDSELGLDGDKALGAAAPSRVSTTPLVRQFPYCTRDGAVTSTYKKEGDKTGMDGWMLPSLES